MLRSSSNVYLSALAQTIVTSRMNNKSNRDFGVVAGSKLEGLLTLPSTYMQAEYAASLGTTNLIRYTVGSCLLPTVSVK